MKVFIIGASGLVGGQCLKHFKSLNWNVIGSHLSFPTPDTVYYNTLEPEHPDNFPLDTFQPDVVVHCGALTHVDYCETNQADSYLKTVESTQSLLKAIRNSQTLFVYLSTDYLFDGTGGPYDEDAAIRPINVYGRHKAEAEQLAQKHPGGALVLRVTNIYGDEIRGKNFVARIADQCLKGTKLTLRLPYDQYATPTNASDIARAMGRLLQDRKTGIYHIGGTDFMNRVELALNILKHFPSAEYDLQPMSTKELKQPAPRPLLAGLISRKFNKTYPDFLFSTLDDYLRDLKNTID